MDFNTSLLKSNYTLDSNNIPVGIPRMVDGSDEYFGEELIYNMKTNAGTIKMGETQMGEGYYFGKAISRVSKKV